MLEIKNEDCRKTIDNMIFFEKNVDCIITSPFYNTGRDTKYYNTTRARKNYEGRYDIHLDDMTDDEYIEFTVNLFNKFDKIVKNNGIVLYNMSYGSENTHLMWFVVSEIIKNTNWTIADDIIWKKKSALPNSTSPNKLTRIVEHIFVFCRKFEFNSFICNKKIKTIGKNGQKYYENIHNFIEAKNNDGSNNLNKATYSTELILKLLEIYVKKGSLIYDPFMGTGTTLNACKIYGCDCIGSEISKAQCDYAYERLKIKR